MLSRQEHLRLECLRIAAPACQSFNGGAKIQDILDKAAALYEYVTQESSDSVTPKTVATLGGPTHPPELKSKSKKKPKR